MPYQDSHNVYSSNSHGGTGFTQHNFGMQKVPSKMGAMQLSQQSMPNSSSGAAAVALPT